MSKNKGAKSATSKPAPDAAPAAGAAPAEAAGSALPPIPVIAYCWAGFAAASIFLAGCPRFTAYYAAYAAASLGLAAGVVLFARAIWKGGRSRLLPAFKKFLGYGLVLHYAASALPRVDWLNAGLIGQGRVVYMFVLSLLALALGTALFVVLGRPSTFQALGLFSAEEARDPALRKKRLAEMRRKGFLFGALDWVDAIGFAAVLVILVNTFVFQLYEIPSESMVPAFLKQDRPFTAKFLAGPRIPLTDWRLPFAKPPARGDIVTLANPRYPENAGVNLKKYLGQLVQMLTFTTVNIDRYLPDGTEKADPLVKRVVGVPGEKLMMVDDVLYSRKQGDADWAPVEADKTWACVDLWKLDPGLRVDERNVIDAEGRAILAEIDALKNSSDPTDLRARLAAAGAAAIARAGALSRSLPAYERSQRARADVGQTFAALSAAADELALSAAASGGANAVAAEGLRIDDLALALGLARSAALREHFAAFCGRAEADLPAAAANAYVAGSRALNLLAKANLAERVSRDLELLAAGAGPDAVAADSRRSELSAQGRRLYVYIAAYYDRRNFPEFPSGDAYLAPDEYFAMGDNRYNSLDFRFDTVRRERALDPEDPTSVTYSSDLRPFALKLKYIEGYALFRVWPPSRLGAIR